MLRSVAALALVGAGIIALVVAAFIPFSTQNEAGADSSDAKMVMTATKDSQHKAEVSTSVNDLYPVISETWGRYSLASNEEQASEEVGFTVKFPRIDSDDYELQLAVTDHLENGNNYVWLFYSENPIPDDMTVNQFWEQGGIIINYHENMTMVRNDLEGTMNYGEWNPSFSNLTAMVEAVKDFGMNAYETTINGHPASVIADVHREFQGFPIHDPTQVDYIFGNTHVTLQGYKDADELIRIAESMPFDSDDETTYNDAAG